jgi:hypothetical protein
MADRDPVVWLFSCCSERKHYHMGGDRAKMAFGGRSQYGYLSERLPLAVGCVLMTTSLGGAMSAVEHLSTHSGAAWVGVGTAIVTMSAGARLVAKGWIARASRKASEDLKATDGQSQTESA